MCYKAFVTLKTYLETTGISQAKFSRELSVSPAMICYMISGKKTPGLGLALKIQRLTRGKVRPEDWVEKKPYVSG